MQSGQRKVRTTTIPPILSKKKRNGECILVVEETRLISKFRKKKREVEADTYLIVEKRVLF